MGDTLHPRQRGRAAGLLKELEDGIAEAQTEMAWYSFIGLEDVRWALRVIATEGDSE